MEEKYISNCFLLRIQTDFYPILQLQTRRDKFLAHGQAKKNIDQRQGLFPDAFSNAAFVIQAQRYAYPLPILFGTISIISYHLDAMYKRILEIFGGIFLINAMFSRKHFLKVIQRQLNLRKFFKFAQISKKVPNFSPLST